MGNHMLLVVIRFVIVNNPNAVNDVIYICTKTHLMFIRPDPSRRGDSHVL